MKNRDFRISDRSRKTMTYFNPVFETDEDFMTMYRQAQEVAGRYNKKHEENVSAAKLHTSAVLHLIYQTVINAYIESSDTDPFSRISVLAEKNSDCKKVLDFFDGQFPSILENTDPEETVRGFFLHQVYQANPALLMAMQQMLSQKDIVFPEGTKALKTLLGSYTDGLNGIADSNQDDLFSFLTLPARLHPTSLSDQITFILKNWAHLLPDSLKTLLLRSLDFMNEEDHPHGFGGPGTSKIPDYKGEPDSESFTEDRNWMPNVVMMAKSTLVWLDQLSKKYKRDIHSLDAIPDEELDRLKESGFTALWLIGLWERSPASKTIKNLCGNQDAESSAYSLKGYTISSRLGGWDALNNLKSRCWQRGIRLASDMVPNHTGLDSDWLYSHPEYFMQQSYSPFPSYSYNGPDLSLHPEIEIKIEDHYFDRTDAAVTFRKRDKRTGETTYIFHGNDGTTMPWNDTAQLDFLNPATREAVIQQILEVARAFPIIRFDAAMTLAKRHIQRLWYPKPGNGGDIAGRATHGMTDEQFNTLIPNEFWREVVDRIQAELPDTLLLAEAFWMMESYFVRTLGMHRVYNSAFMHMMKNQENKKYKDSIKATLEFDPEILKRYVNFMNNPDEDTAIAQFGNGDKYFGVCTLLATMPGLPMFGHGQIEGFQEKYGMEFQRAYWDETPDEGLINEHRRKIFPLLKMRRLFSECRYFQLFDVINNGAVEDSVFAYTNGDDSQMTLVLYNNRYEHAEGTILNSAPKLVKSNNGRYTETVTIGQSLRLTMSGRRFVIYKNFSDGLFYLEPSLKIFEDGLHVSLNGYETKVYTDIHEVEDIDGIYQKLYERLNGQGTGDIEKELRLLYLEPFFEAASSVTNPKFTKDLKSILTGRSSASSRRNLLQSLGTCYTYMEELNYLFEKLGLHEHSMKPADVVEFIKTLEKTCTESVFTHGNLLMENDIAKTVTAYLLIKPFYKGAITMETALSISSALMLDRLFDEDALSINRCAILASSGLRDVEQLLYDNSFLYLIGANEYQGIHWYNGEAFQECVYIVNLADALTDRTIEDYDKEINKWLEKNNSANYRIDNLR